MGNAFIALYGVTLLARNLNTYFMWTFAGIESDSTVIVRRCTCVRQQDYRYRNKWRDTREERYWESGYTKVTAPIEGRAWYSALIPLVYSRMPCTWKSSPGYVGDFKSDANEQLLTLKCCNQADRQQGRQKHSAKHTIVIIQLISSYRWEQCTLLFCVSVL